MSCRIAERRPERRHTVILDSRPCPIVLAPLAGGPSTPELTAAVSGAGALGFLAAGYLTAACLAERLTVTRHLTSEPFGVNVFVPGEPAGQEDVARYAASLAGTARDAGVELGDPVFEDDDWAAKLALLLDEPVPVVSFTFGCPGTETVARLHGVGSEVWVTVGSPQEAAEAAAAGADVLVAQGSEAGGHRGGSHDDPGVGLLSLLQLMAAHTDLPLVATGGIATGAAVAAVLAAGARAAALGTAFLRCPEAGTAQVHREALHGSGTTAVTRAFTGRAARGIRNRFLDRHTTDAPAAYPEVHHLTAPLRQAGRARGEADLVNLWAGQTYPLVRDLPAAELVRRIDAETEAALRAALTAVDRYGAPATES
jgi:nitronate monooxygenase